LHPSQVSSQTEVAVEVSAGLCREFSQVMSRSSREIMMSDLTEQRINLRFCFYFGKSTMESLEMLQKTLK